MALLFEVDRTRITRHIKNIFGELELSEKAICIFAHCFFDINIDKIHFNIYIL